MRFKQNVDDGVVLRIDQTTASATSLELAYTVTNGTGGAIYLVNQLFHRRGAAGFQVDRNLVYAAVGEDRTLSLRKQLIEVPEELDVEAPEVPYLTHLAAGTSYSEAIRVAIPVRLHDPYRPQTTDAPTDTASRVVFSLGYMEADPDVRVSEVDAPSGTHRWLVGYTDLLLRQRIKVAEPFSATVPIDTTSRD